MSHLPSLHNALLFITRQKKRGRRRQEEGNAHVGRSRQNESDKDKSGVRELVNKRVRKQRDEDKDTTRKRQIGR